MAEGVKRSYDASRRRAQAAALRRQVVDVATPLFVEQGYEATSMRQVAEAAGVAPQTLYNAFDSKFGLFSAVIDVVIAGDHEPVALAERPELLALQEVDDPRRLLEAIVAVTVPVLGRLQAIYPTLRAAAGSDEQVRAAYRHFALDARHQDLRALADRLAAVAEVDVDRAADVLWAVLSPDVHHLLVSERGWSPEAFAEWAVDALVGTLLVGGVASAGPEGRD